MRLKSNPQVPRGICATCDPLFNYNRLAPTNLLSLIELGNITIDEKLTQWKSYFVGLMRDIKQAGASG